MRFTHPTRHAISTAKGIKSVSIREKSKGSYRKSLYANGLWITDFRGGNPDKKIPEMTDEYCNSVSERYIELYEKKLWERNL